MVSDASADPWSAPNSDPWRNTSGWNDAEAADHRPTDVNEPNTEANARDQDGAGNQSSGDQESGGGAADAPVDSWHGNDWN